MTPRQAKRQAAIESKKRIESAQAETRRIVASGKCPNCNAGIRRNLALHGWWQCEQFGDGHFRKDQSKSSCNWQGFTA